MKTLQQISGTLLTFSLLLACAAALTGCGDEQDSRLSNADVACLKLMQAGYSNCSSLNTTSVTATVTATATATSTVTVTSTTTN